MKVRIIKVKWYEGSIQKMLSNEKYKGEALLQKTYTVDFLTKKRAENTGQVPQYYVEESHPAIIDKDMWEAVQLEMERRQLYATEHGTGYGTNDNPFAGRVVALAVTYLVERFGILLTKSRGGLYGGVGINIRLKELRGARVSTLMMGFYTEFL